MVRRASKSASLIHSPRRSQQSPKRVTLLVKPRSQTSGGLAIVATALGMAAVLTLGIGGVILGVQLVFSAHPPSWLEAWLPFDNPSEQPPQSLAEIEQAVAPDGLTVGQRLALASSGRRDRPTQDWLFPLLKTQANCQTDCQSIQAIRVYRTVSSPGEVERFQLLDQWIVPEPTQATIVAPLVGTALENLGSSQVLPLTDIQTLPETAEQGQWLTLYGRWRQGGTSVWYGQVVFYNPAAGRLKGVLPWVSPSRQLPLWHNLDGRDSPELIVNQTIDLEPRLLAYQLKAITPPSRPAQVQPISLFENVLPSESGKASYDRATYDTALRLAQAGLWSAALARMQQVKTKAAQYWPAEAEAQLQLIQLHANITQAQAKQTWARPGQQILAYLIDGQWENAFKLFLKEEDAQPEILALLKQDRDRLWHRILASLRVEPNQPAAQLWGALTLATQQTPQAALAWLTERKAKPDIRDRFQTLWVRSHRPSPAKPTSAAVPVVNTHSAPVRALLGTATPLNQITTGDWLSLGGALTTDPDTRWYQIQLDYWHSGESWQPGTAGLAGQSAAALSQALGLTDGDSLQLLLWSSPEQAESYPVTVRAVRRVGNQVWLLASSSTPLRASQALPALAITAGSLNWLDPSTAISLAQVQQQDEARGQQLVQQLQSVLGVKAEVLTPLLDTITLHSLDVTGDQRPDTLIGLPTTLLAQLKVNHHTTANSADRLLILDASGQVAYNDITQAQSFLALTPPQRNGSVSLLVFQSGRYQIQPWSAAAGRFD